jgi:hypothetical protein
MDILYLHVISETGEEVAVGDGAICTNGVTEYDMQIVNIGTVHHYFASMTDISFNSGIGAV